MIFGYARVSTIEQNLDRQIFELEKAGSEEIIQEKITGTKFDRPELNKLLNKLRKGDVLIITELTRLSRSTKDLFYLFEVFEEKGVDIQSLKESWLNTTTPQGKLMFTIMSGISQFERDLISQRTKEGLMVARARGRVGGRKPMLDLQEKMAVYELYIKKSHSIKKICDMFRISKPTMYKAVKEISQLKINC